MIMLVIIVLILSIFVPGFVYLKWPKIRSTRKATTAQTEDYGDTIALKTEQFLCATCKKANLEMLFTNTHRSPPCQMTWVIRLKLDAPCKFCALLRTIVAMHEFGPRVQFVKIEIVKAAGDPLPFIHIYTPWWVENQVRPTNFKPSSDFGEESIISPWTIWAIGSEVQQQVRKNFVPWKRAVHFLDIDLAKTWIAECVEDHKESCSPVQELTNDVNAPVLTNIAREQKKWFGFLRRGAIPSKVVSRTAHPPDTLRLIDVRSWCLHTEAYTIGQSQVPRRYVALSYVWGEGESKKLLKDNLTQWHEHGRLPRDLPRTILHALELTLAMGEQYLWTDRLCIVQDDPKEMGNTMQHMYSVYMNAVFTIVAASGTNCDAGLNGFVSNQPWSNPVCSIRGRDLALGCWDPFHELRTSKWITRGWTFQEMVCSRRSLLLMGSSVAFVCARSIKHQDRWGVCDIVHSPWARSLIPVTAHNTDYPTESKETLVDERSSTKQLEDLLRGYIARDLTKKSDRLNAFAGILSYMESDLGRHHFGIPKNIFGDAIAWSVCSTITRGGLWQPSWSWVSWEFTKQEPSLEFPQGEEAILSIYRGDDLGTPLSAPKSGMEVVLTHFRPDKYTMERAVARIEPSRRKTPYFELQRLTQLEKEYPEASLYSLLASHLLVFYTSCLALESDQVSLKEGRAHDDEGKMRRWDFYDDMSGLNLTSILLPADTRPDAWGTDSLIVIQKALVATEGYKQPGDRLGYRLMLIRTEDSISHRLGVTEGCVDIQQWHKLRPKPTRELIILG